MGVSYPLRYPSTWILTMYSIANIRFRENDIIQLKLKLVPLKFLLLVIILIVSSFLVKDIRFENEWMKIQKKVSILNDEEVIGSYERLYKMWNGDPFFLYNYGAELNAIGEYTKSIQILSLCSSYFNDVNVQMLQADNNFMIQKWDKAIEHYNRAFFMCPNRFLPLQGLLRSYISSGNVDEAVLTANIIVEKRVKIPSFSVSLIKQEAELFLQETNKNN